MVLWLRDGAVCGPCHGVLDIAFYSQESSDPSRSIWSEAPKQHPLLAPRTTAMTYPAIIPSTREERSWPTSPQEVVDEPVRFGSAVTKTNSLTGTWA